MMQLPYLNSVCASLIETIGAGFRLLLIFTIDFKNENASACRTDARTILSSGPGSHNLGLVS